MVRLGRILPRRHDGFKGQALCAKPANRRIELQCKGTLTDGAASSRKNFKNLAERCIGNSCCFFHHRDLFSILDHAKLFDHFRNCLHLSPRQALLPP